MRSKKIMIMAGGTGGHVFPALAVAEYLSDQGFEINWLGTSRGLEQHIIPAHNYRLFTISISGLRGKRIFSWLLAPLQLSIALLQSLIILKKVNPDIAVGFGGFTSGPGGIAAWLMKIPLLIHEQNAIAGTTNQLLALIANKVMQAFPGTFSDRTAALLTGNPVRRDILQIYSSKKQLNCEVSTTLHLLILGGSQGSLRLNQLVPETIAKLNAKQQIEITHQTGEKHFVSTQKRYDFFGVTAKLMPFFEDMAEVYKWADIIICRAGAMTIAELSAVGVGSILIPFPYAIDDHQTANARYLSNNLAAILIPEKELTVNRLCEVIDGLSEARARIIEMARNARALSMENATIDIANLCMECANV